MPSPRKLVAAALGLAAVALGISPARAANVDKYLPNDTQAVITVNVKQLLDAEFVKKYALDVVKGQLEGNAEAAKVLKDLGLDPLRDVDTIVLASSGEGDRGLLIFHGKFDGQKIAAKAADVAEKDPKFLKIHKVPSGGSEKYTVYEIAKSIGLEGTTLAVKDKPGFGAVLGRDTVVFSPAKDYVIDALDKANGRKKVHLKSKELEGLLKAATGKQHIWIASMPDALSKVVPGGNDSQVKDFLEGINAISGGITVDADVKAEVLLTAKDAQTAKDRGETVNEIVTQGLGVLGILAGQNKQLKPVLEVLKTVKVKDKEKVVIVQAALTKDVMENALKNLRKQPQPTQPRPGQR